MTTDHNEAMRLAEAITDYSRLGFETEDQAKLRRIKSHKEAAALIRKQAERIAELEADYQRLMDKHNAMHVNALKHRNERDTLRAEVERLRNAMTAPTIEPNSQNWAGMDGAIAFHLIERHADSWADAGRMMSEWREANDTARKATQ